jgi:hypothetical protein
MHTHQLRGNTTQYRQLSHIFQINWWKSPRNTLEIRHKVCQVLRKSLSSVERSDIISHIRIADLKNNTLKTPKLTVIPIHSIARPPPTYRFRFHTTHVRTINATSRNELPSIDGKDDCSLRSESAIPTYESTDFSGHQ